MKVTIEIEPKELTDFLIAHADGSYKAYRLIEEQAYNMVLEGLKHLTNKDNTTTDQEVPIGGYFH